VKQTNDGSFILAGRKQLVEIGRHAMYCMKTDNSGIKIWDNTFPNGLMSEALDLQLTNDGGFIMIGSTTSTINDLNSKIFLVKTDSQGFTAISENLTNNMIVTVFPNPFSDNCIIQLNTDKFSEFRIVIYNSIGQIIREIKNLSENSFTFSKDNLSTGFYFYNIERKNKIMASGKIIRIE